MLLLAGCKRPRLPLFLALLLILNCQAATYFVAPTGSDKNAGTNLDAPFRTVSKAASHLVAGDTCLIRAGVYREKLVPAHSGTRAAPITFAAYSNEVVTVSAAENIDRWTRISPGLYQAPAAADLGNGYNQVFVDGEMIHQARYPSCGGSDLLHPATVDVSVNGNTVTSSALGGRPDNFWAGGWFTGGIDVRWSWQCARIVRSSGNQITVDPATKSNPWFTGGGVGLVWGLSSLMDAPNEWHLDATRRILLVRLPGGGSPAEHEVEMKARNWCVDVKGRDYIRIRGLQFRGGAVRLEGNSNLLEDCRARYLSHFLKYGAGYAYDGSLAQGGGIVLKGVGNTVRGCTIYDTAGSGIISSGGANTIHRNLIYNTDYSGTYACAIRLNGWYDQVSYNTAYRSGRDILQPGGAGHAISFNDLSFAGQMCRDLGVVYAWGVNAQTTSGITTRIAHNWIHDNASSGPAPLVYFDNWSRNFVLDHNVIWNSPGDSGIRINAPASGHQLYYNTLFNCDSIGTHTYNMWPDNNPEPSFWTGNFYQYTARNNLFLGSWPQTQLVDWTKSDFRLKPWASAINTGTRVAGFTDSLKVSGAPDQGAYEFNGLMWKPGVNGWVQPSLKVSYAGPGTITLTAPPGAAYFQLLMTTNYGARANWQVVTNKPVASYNGWSLTLPTLAGESRYYRLQAR